MTESEKKQFACLSCQKCCKEFGLLTYFEWNEENLEYFQARGFLTSNYNGNIVVWTDKFPCPHLTKNGCNIYETRPEICKKYDGRENLGSDCAWSELDLDDKKEGTDLWQSEKILKPKV